MYTLSAVNGGIYLIHYEIVFSLLSGAAARNKYIDILKGSAEKYKTRNFGYIMST